MKMAFYRVMILLVFLTLGACSKEMTAVAQSPKKSQITPEALAAEKYQTKCECISNKTQTHALCRTRLHSLHDGSLSFFVFDNDKQKIIYEEDRVSSVNWVNDQKIKILPYVGMPSGQRVAFYYYHMTTGIMKPDGPGW